MSRGRNRWWTEPPWWAWPVIVVGVVVLVVGVPIVSGRGKLTAEELARIEASRPAETAAPTAEVPVALPPLQAQRPTDGPLRVMFSGDSLTESVHASAEGNGFRPLMISAWEQGGEVEPLAYALSGEGVGRVAAVGEVPPNLHIAVIELGTNDVSRTELPEFDVLYGDLVDRIRVASPDAAIICAGVWQPPRYESRQFDAVIERHCTRVGGRYAPLFDLHLDSANRGPAGREVYGGYAGHNISDDFHPNDAGYRAIADRLLPLVNVV